MSKSIQVNKLFDQHVRNSCDAARRGYQAYTDYIDAHGLGAAKHTELFRVWQKADAAYLTALGYALKLGLSK